MHRTARAGSAEWVYKCRDVLNKVLKALGPDRSVFYDPVNPQMLPDYYRVVTNPIFLGQVEEKLNSGGYSAPQEFADDVRQHWVNVRLYNPVGDPFRRLGEKVGVQGGQAGSRPRACGRMHPHAAAGSHARTHARARSRTRRLRSSLRAGGRPRATASAPSARRRAWLPTSSTQRHSRPPSSRHAAAGGPQRRPG